MQKYEDVVIPRNSYLKDIEQGLRHNPICALLGPRQCGKTTLARQYVAKRAAHYFDLETAMGRARLAEPETALSALQGTVVIDEIQRRPELFTVLRPLVDRSRSKTKFLVLGSASPTVVRGVSESLAGRVRFVDVAGFDLNETGPATWRKLWLRGGFPRSYLAPRERASFEWRQDFVRTFLERDIAHLGFRIPAETLRRFWMMVAHSHGQVWNGAELARSLGVSEHTVRGYLDVLAGTYVVRVLAPWFENIGKRQFKSPKVYIRDSGLLHALLDLEEGDIEAHPKCGASWEGFALEQVLRAARADQAYFWGTHAGAELDLLLLRRGRRYGVEFKYADAPRMTKSLHVALDALKLDKAWVVYPGAEEYPIHPQVVATPVTGIPKTFSLP